MSLHYYTPNVVLSVYGALLIIFGTIGNGVSFIVCVQKRLRQNPTFVFLAFMLVVNTFALYVWFFNLCFRTYHGNTIGDFHSIACRTMAYVQIFNFTASATFVVFMAYERLLSICISNWRKLYFKAKHALISCIFIVIVYLTCSSYIITYLTYEPISNLTRLGACWKTPEYTKYAKTYPFMYACIPSLLLLIANMLLLYNVFKQRNRIFTSVSRHRIKQTSLTITIIILTVLFVLQTFPFLATGIFANNNSLGNELGQFGVFAAHSIALTFYASNFITLVLTNAQFKHELTDLFKRFKLKFKHSLGREEIH